MSLPINLNFELVLDAESIENEAAMWVLPPELKAGEAPVTQGVPKLNFHER